MKKLTRVLAALLVLCMILSLLPTVFAEESKSNFAFLVTSDLHGQIFATDYTVDASQSGTYKRGLTRVSSYIKEMRQEYGDNLYVADLGDTIQGAPLTYYYAFNKPDADPPAVKAFRSIGYDMWVVGNHEFNYGLNILNRQLDYATSPSTETEKQLSVCMANYLDAATNSDESKDWKTWKGYAPYVIKDFGGVKVAVIGFGNPNIPTWDIPANWEGIYFANIIDTYKHYEPEMKEKADMIVVAAHSGVNSDEKSDFIEQLVKETDSISFAFSGHEHNNKDWTIQNAKGEDVHVLQPFTKARAIAQVKVSYDKTTGKADIDTALVNMENYKLDEDLVKVLQPYEDATWKEYMLEKIGEADGDFTAAELGTKPSAFMDLVNTVQLWGAYDNTGVNTPDNPKDDKPAQLSISAPLTSGDNANIIDKGDIYLGDMFKLYRFENWFYQITMKGEELHQWLEFAATKIKTDASGKPYVNSGDLTYYDVIYGNGFSYVIDYTKPEGSRVVSMTYEGKPIAANQTFTVVVNNYRYNGGGHYIEWLNSHGCNFVANDPARVIYSTQFDMIQGEDKGQARNLLTDYIRTNGTITPTITSTWSLATGYKTFEIFETTDVHGYLTDTSSGKPETFQYRLARIAKIVKDARANAANNGVLLFDGGDIYQGTPVSNLIYGNALRAAYDKMGYDAVALGNHEFDWDVTKYATDAEGTMPAYEVGSFTGDSSIPVLAYNLFDAGTTTHSSIVKDYVILDKDGVSVAVIGYIPDYSMDIMAAKIAPYDIDPDLDKLNAKIDSVIAAEKPDVVMVLAHASPAYLAKALDPNKVDLVLGGHSHTASFGVADNGIAYIQGNCQAKGYANAKLQYNTVTGEAEVLAPNYISITDKRDALYDNDENKANLDPDVLAISHAAWDAVKDQMEEVLGTVDRSITRRVKIGKSTNTIAGNWLAGLMLEATKDMNTVVAFTNSGGIRCDLMMEEGATTRNITVGDIYTISPFGNRLLTFDATGAELAKTVENAFRNANYGDQFSGMFVKYKATTGTDGRPVRTVTSIVLDDGTVVDIHDNTKTYRIAINEYCATLPGSAFEKKTPVQDVNEAPIDNLSAIEALRRIGKDNGGVLPLDLNERCVKEEDAITYELVPDSGNMFKYGHLDLNVSTEEFLKHFNYGDIVTVSFNGKSYDFPVCSNYDDVDTHQLLIRAATGKKVVTMAINYGQLGVEAGIIEPNPDAGTVEGAPKYRVKDGVTFPIVATVTMKEAGGYADELSVRQLNRTNNREDYPELTDEQFANFRNIATTGMGAGILYRSSSPINPELGRNTYADKAASAAGIKTFINLADSVTEAKGYAGYDDSYYAKQNVVFLNLPVAFTTDEFKNGLAEGFRFITKNEGPYLVHCTEGKDRAGLTAAILECLMGASADEVANDYLTTFRNYYNVVDGKQVALTEAQEAYLRNAILKNLCLIFDMADAAKADLAKEAEAYMKEIGLTDAEIAKLRENLSKSTALRIKTVAPSTTEIDKYGDVRLSITSGELLAAGFEYADYVTVEFLDQKLTLPVIPEYRYVGAREAGLVAWKDASKPVELEIFNGSFAASYGLATKTTNPDKSYVWNANEGVTFPVEITITLAQKGGYKDQYEVYDLVRTNNREDYKDLTDEQFANFRMVGTTGMGYGVLYRSSSPINPAIGRNTYADAAAKAHGVKTIMNLADNQAKAEAYAGYADTYYSKQNVAFLGIGVDFLSETNRTGLAEGLRYFATHDGPYLVHCNEGQDRAGFTSALLECLMGASLDEVKTDYAVTYMNYYGVKVGTTQYTTISNNIVKNLKTIFGVETLEGADLAKLAETYIKGLGLTDEEIAKLRTNLAGKSQFHDVTENDWFYDYVVELTARGVVNGVSPTEFEPNENLTRAHLVTMVYRLAGEPTVEATTSKFTDVKENSYYFKATVWAEQNGIINGTSETTFEPDAFVTREQMVTILYRFSGDKGSYEDKLDGYKDAADIYHYAKNAVGWATEKGVVAGYPDGTFQPKGNATRAEAAKVLVIFAKLTNR